MHLLTSWITLCLTESYVLLQLLPNLWTLASAAASALPRPGLPPPPPTPARSVRSVATGAAPRLALTPQRDLRDRARQTVR